MKKNTKQTITVCPCGSGKALSACCGRYHAGEPAPDPVSLMRSRYSAYVLNLESYLLSTWHPSTRPDRIDPDPQLKWLSLEVLSSQQEGDLGWVDFVARYKINGRAGRMKEKSRFLQESGCWFYVTEAIVD